MMKNLKPLDLRVYLVMDRATLGTRPARDVLLSAIQGGVTFVQLRDKESSDESFIEWAKPLVALLKEVLIPVVINDRIEVARQLKADGVHLGATDESWSKARQILGPDAIVGLSVENEDQALDADAADVDYLGVSAVFTTTTKNDLRFLWGLEGLRGLRLKIRKPLVAIGGINPANAATVIEAGADGVAVVSAICASEDPCRATRELRKLFQKEEIL